MSKKVTASQILKKLELLHAGATPPWVLYSEVKSGPSWGQKTPWGTKNQDLYIMDAVAIKCSWSNPCIEGFEIKVNRSDFLRDKKWQNYQAYCHKFSFVCPPGVIKVDELPGDVGLLYYNAELDCVWVKRRALYRKIDLKSDTVVSMLLYLTYYRAGDNQCAQ